MKQKLLFFFLCCVSILKANAQTFNFNSINYNVTNATAFEVAVTNNQMFIGDANIPATVNYNSNTYTVVSIESLAFQGNNNLSTVTIPNSVISIGSSAFSGCTSLTSVTIPNSVTSIGTSAFLNCSDLNSITIPNSITNISIETFSGCTSLTSITIPNSVTSIGSRAFYDCTGLTSVNIPNSVTSIGSYAFYQCNNLTSVTIPNGITTIEQATFQFCNRLASISIPNSVTTIGNDAFRYCTTITSITIPNSVTSIGSYAFGSNYGVTNVTLPNTITSIGDGGFAYLYSLNTFTVQWQVPLDITSIVFQGTNINNKTLNVPAGISSLYDNAPVWTQFNIVAGPDTTPRGCWAQLSVGGQHTLAIAQDGTLWAWGDNSSGQLGNNIATGNLMNPLQISSNPNWAFVSAGEFYSLAIKKDGTLWAWGNNSYGQLGNGNTVQQNIPVQIGTDTNWIGIYAGYQHSVAKKVNKTVWAWGRNTYGQIGNNTTTDQLTPLQVGTDTNWQSVSLGRTHTVALKNNGQLWSWGRNNYGQLGIGNTTQQLIPVQIGSDTNWKAIEAGDYHTVALKNNGTIYSWGENGSGQLGLGDTTNRNSPTQIGIATDWKSIATGAYHGYAVKSTGTLWAWGDNYFGQVGNGNFTQQNSPVQIGTATDWYSVFSGDYYGVSQKNNGNFLSWGDNQSGQLGNGNTTPNTTGQNTPAGMNCSGNVLAFDGVDDRVVIQNLGTGIIGDNSANESYTFIIKVKIPSVGATPFISKKTTTPTNQGFSIETDASGIVFFDQAYGGVFRRVQASSPLAANTWYTISATFDYPNKTHKLFINDNEVATFTDTATPQFVTTTVKLTLGIPEGTSPSAVTTSFMANFAQALNISLNRLDIIATSARSNQNQAQLDVQPANYLFKYQFNQGIANANNMGITTMQNEVFSSPYVGTLENFALTGSTSNWTNDVTASETLSTNNFAKKDDLLVYPNPSTGVFKISLQEDSSIEIYNLLGKVVYSNKVNAGESTIDISSLQLGLYLLEVKSNKGVAVKKIIKQ